MRVRVVHDPILGIMDKCTSDEDFLPDQLFFFWVKLKVPIKKAHLIRGPLYNGYKPTTSI